MSDRKDHIEVLKQLYVNYDLATEWHKKVRKTLQFAINSLDVDEAYNLMYEETTQRECDRNICLRNEYNGIGCENCEVMRSTKKIPVNLHITKIEKHQSDFSDLESTPTITLDELKEIREEISKKKILYTHPHELAKNVYREAVNNVLAILDKKISELEGKK